MYEVKEVIVRLNREWMVIDFATVTVMELINKYDKILVNLLEANTTLVKQYSLKDFLHIYLTPTNVTLVDFFAAYGNFMPTNILPIKSMPTAKHISYHSIWRFGLQADRGYFDSTALSENNNYHPDIVITKPVHYPNTLEALHNNVLYLVNGLVFFEEFKNGNAYLRHATATLDRYHTQQIAVIDFSAVGGYNPYILTAQNTAVFKQDATSATVIVTLPISLGGVTPLLIKNRQLRILDNNYEVIADNKIAIKLKYVEMISDLVEIPAAETNWIKAANTDGAGYDLTTIDPIAYLTGGTSAILILNTGELSIQREDLARTGFADSYTSANLPTGIIYLEDGTIADYVVTAITSYGKVISATPPKVKQAMKDTIQITDSTGLNNVSMVLPAAISTAQLLNLYVL